MIKFTIKPYINNSFQILFKFKFIFILEINTFPTNLHKIIITFKPKILKSYLAFPVKKTWPEKNIF